MNSKNNKNCKRPLWAPWRIEYINSSEDKSTCFLCSYKNPSKQKNEYLVVKRGKFAFVILNAFPYNSGHLMIAPYEHIKEIEKLKRQVRYEIMDLSIESKLVLEKTMKPDGFNIGFNLNRAAGVGLEGHLHLHIVPRWIGDTNFMPVLDNTRVVSQALRDTANLLRKKFRQK